MTHGAACRLQGLGHVEFGDGDSGAETGLRPDFTARVDDLGAADEAERPEGAGLVGRQPHDLVLQGPGPVEQTEAALPPLPGEVAGGIATGARPGRDTDAGL